MVMFFSCSEDDMVSPTASDLASVEQSTTTGDWRITYYFDDEDETSDYQGYVFTFSEDGRIEARRGGSTYVGRWNVERNDDDDERYDLEFYIDFDSPDELEDLDDDWYIKSFTNSRMELVDDDDDDEDDEILIMERN
jgi:hypothetical protein